MATKIPWVKNPNGSQGITLNPITGCLNHVDGKCKGGGFPCYAYRLAHGRLRTRYLANTNIAPVVIPYSERQYDGWEKQKIIGRALSDPFYPRFWPERLDEIPITGHGKPKGIFVCDMSDLFGIGIPEQWTREVLEQCKEFSSHRFYLLTKQP